MEGYKYQSKKDEERAGKVVLKQDFGDAGLTVRAIHEIFDQAEDSKKNKTVNIYCSFLQIYNEKVFDLLNSKNLKGSGKMQ